MNGKAQQILEQFRKERVHYVALGELVHTMLTELVTNDNIKMLGIEYRVKQESSLAGKLARKGDKYLSLDDLTDILGARMICFYADDVDKIGQLLEKNFVIDWENCVDKRALMDANRFGYLSLHYICSLPTGKGYPQELCGKRFEIQIRTVLQHAWSLIDHDLNYKSALGIPRDMVRAFARLAGLLELADEEFMRMRDGIQDYTQTVCRKIAQDCANDVDIDLISLQAYVSHNPQMQTLTAELAAICGSAVEPVSPEGYIAQLRWLGKKTLGDLQAMLADNHDLALALAKQALSGTGLDILSSNIGLRFLCRAELLNKGYTPEQMTAFFKLTTNNDTRAQRQAASLLRAGQELDNAHGGC
ncbi:MAG: GTP pyrophosphokinase family protein [Aristaeellaceae bacterium]